MPRIVTFALLCPWFNSCRPMRRMGKDSRCDHKDAVRHSADVLFSHVGPTTQPYSDRHTTQMCISQTFARWRYIHSITFLANDVRYNVVVRPSVVCLSVVCNVHTPYSGDWNFRQCFYAIWYLGHPWHIGKIFTEIVPGELLRRES